MARTRRRSGRFAKVTSQGGAPSTNQSPATKSRSVAPTFLNNEFTQAQSQAPACDISEMPAFKDDSILIIAPGSHTTLYLLGLPESFTPARGRFKTRMFPAEKPGQWEPYKIRKKNEQEQTNNVNGQTNGEKSADAEGADSSMYEDHNTDEGAVWPIQGGKIVNWDCFAGLLTYIHRQLDPHVHTPILFISQPIWTHREHERIAQIVFEMFKVPGFAIMDSATATCYAYGVETACVVDVGADKADVTAVAEYLIDHPGRSSAIPGCGGEAMTQRLHELLQPKGFTRDMCEQLKKSPICEILPQGTPLPGSQDEKDDVGENPASAASTGADGPGPGQRNTPASAGGAPRGPGPDTEVGDETNNEEENEGIVDVAGIVAGGKMNEYLARKEKEKQEKVATKNKKGQENTAAQARPVRLKNSERERNTFYYEDHALLDALKNSNMDANGVAEAQAALDETPQKEKDSGEKTSPTTTSPQSTSFPSNPLQAPRREMSVGTERFLAGSGDILMNLSTAIHKTILAHRAWQEDKPKHHLRPDLWNNIIISGNGSRIRGFKEALIATLHSRFLISPSSATMFTSEIPSNISTPAATGANTPTPAQQHAHAHSHTGHGGGVNPLLLAATTASAQSQQISQSSGHPVPPNPNIPPHLTPHQQHPQPQFQQHQQQYQSVNMPSQTPTSIKTAKLPEYFPEWKDAGTDEAVFLGAQVAARVIFTVDQGSNKGFMSRGEYNDAGPAGIHDYVM